MKPRMLEGAVEGGGGKHKEGAHGQKRAWGMWLLGKWGMNEWTLVINSFSKFTPSHHLYLDIIRICLNNWFHHWLCKILFILKSESSRLLFIVFPFIVHLFVLYCISQINNETVWAVSLDVRVLTNLLFCLELSSWFQHVFKTVLHWKNTLL